jgi:hypothetical protein
MLSLGVKSWLFKIAHFRSARRTGKATLVAARATSPMRSRPAALARIAHHGHAYWRREAVRVTVLSAYVNRRPLMTATCRSPHQSSASMPQAISVARAIAAASSAHSRSSRSINWPIEPTKYTLYSVIAFRRQDCSSPPDPDPCRCGPRAHGSVAVCNVRMGRPPRGEARRTVAGA